ncbi:ImmA/IrrE family metallo-endopeptidase [Radicibacter daui]|uniref:ImmA/IrrE family metallo-endopeptidase n=1 Tax=Radicibacter daui TaxID=3064829 RepID=UPI004046C3E9
MALKIDRMEIDDVGGNPRKLAASIIKQLPETSGAIPVREIAEAIDIYEIKEAVLDGLEGGLIVAEDKSEGAILVRSDRPERRKRYTIAHEIGHYVNPWHKASSPEGFRCRSSDMRLDRYKKNDPFAQMEVEANEFAAELLMPIAQLKHFLKGKSGADIGQILGISDRFDVSREAAARRFVDFSEEPIVILFSHDGVIRYVKSSEDAPKISVWGGDRLPLASLSVTYPAKIGKVTGWEEVPGHVWLERSRGYTVYEQTLSQNNKFRMTLLSFEKEEEEEGDWVEPIFRR